MVTNKGGYLCYCMHGMTESGKCRNSTDFCEKKQGKSPCRNNGTCYSYKNTFKCVCPAGFIGKLCQRSLNPKKTVQKVQQKIEDQKEQTIEININSPDTTVILGGKQEGSQEVEQVEKEPQVSQVNTQQEEESSQMFQLLFILFFVSFFVGLFVFVACVCKERIRKVMNRNKSSKSVITIKRSGSGEQYQVKESGNHQGNQVTKVVIETGTTRPQIAAEESKVPFITSTLSEEGLSSEEEGDYMDSFKFREKSAAIMTSQQRRNFHQSGDGAESKQRCQETSKVPQKGKYLPDVTVV